MFRLLPILLFAGAAWGAPKVESCLRIREYRMTMPRWPDEVERPGGFYWVDTDNRCGVDISSLYVVVSFQDQGGEHLADTFWSLYIPKGQKATNRFTTPKMDRPYGSIRTVTITRELMEAVCLTDRSRCGEWKR